MTDLVPARERFAALVATPDSDPDLAEAALWIAAEEYPDLDVPAYLARLDEIAVLGAPHVLGARDPREQVERLNRFLFEEQGFRGNQREYEDPRNSFLNEVLDRRLGIPITLALVYIEVARRIGLEAHGISFPGHFLAKVVGARDIVVDAFFGRVLSLEECEERLRQQDPAAGRFDPALHLRRARPREILVRMLANLKRIAAAQGDAMRILGCIDRMLLVVPSLPLELRDRALLYEHLGWHSAALADWRELAPFAREPEHQQALRQRIRMLEARVGRLN
jgi:regulator of sirC expression with transglutaminase-like and TPR domain